MQQLIAKWTLRRCGLRPPSEAVQGLQSYQNHKQAPEEAHHNGHSKHTAESPTEVLIYTQTTRYRGQWTHLDMMWFNGLVKTFVQT